MSRCGSDSRQDQATALGETAVRVLGDDRQPGPPSMTPPDFRRLARTAYRNVDPWHTDARRTARWVGGTNDRTGRWVLLQAMFRPKAVAHGASLVRAPVSYTHLTLPTICSV